MAITKPRKKSQPENDTDLQSEVANFASSIGLSSSLQSSGFNDSSFRKKPIQNPKNEIIDKKPDSNPKFDKFKKPFPKPDSNPKFDKFKKPYPKPRLQQPFSTDNSKQFDKFKNLPNLPLMKANSLGVWYTDAADLEAKIIGTGSNRKKSEFKNVEEWKGLVEKKKELAERLLGQYVVEYEQSRGQSGDIKMVLATQRSGTVTDKVSAFSVLVGDNPIANIRAIDSLVGNVL